MMRLYFSPQCVQPPFLVEDKYEVKRCWALDGIFYAVLLIVVMFISWTIYQSHVERVAGDHTTRVFIVMSLMLLIVVPNIFSFSGGNLWEGYQITIRRLLNEGFSKKEAINFLQGVDDINRKTDAKSASLGRLVFAKGEEKEKSEKDKNE
jgi:hypothetical protein